MTSPLRRLASLALATAALTAAACGGKQVDLSIPVDEARLLNSDVSTSFVRTRDLLADTAQTVRGLGTFPDGIDAQDVDVDLIEHVLNACVTETPEMVAGADRDALPRGARAELGPENAPLTQRPAVGRIEACNPSRMLALGLSRRCLARGARVHRRPSPHRRRRPRQPQRRSRRANRGRRARRRARAGRAPPAALDRQREARHRADIRPQRRGAPPRRGRLRPDQRRADAGRGRPLAARHGAR